MEEGNYDQFEDYVTAAASFNVRLAPTHPLPLALSPPPNSAMQQVFFF